MNTNTLKRFAKDARIKLLDQVGRKLDFVLTHDTAELRGKTNEIAQLRNKITEIGKAQVIEMVAYTWFNRLMALRFMDANGYSIPKVITPLEAMTNPEILQNALGGNIEPELKIDRHRLNDLLDGKTAATDAHTEAFKMLLVASCNQWHTAMPFMFERISDYTELLLPDDLLSDYSIVADIRNGMSDDDCQQEELIGWLYQFYIADKKDEVFDGLKKNIKITAENIPAATQLFTPRWIVRYMVENTLGKLWLTLKPNSKLRQHMPYYIEAPEGNAPAPLPEGINGIKDITFLDPCQGSGHVLVYAFDLFTKIYEEEGYNTNEIPALILEQNLFGIDIDERAAQLAAFALTMKARSYYPRFLRKPVQPNVIALRNCNFTKREIERISIPALCEEFKNILAIVKPQHTPYLETELYHLARNVKKELSSNIRALLFDELNNLTYPTTIAALIEKEEEDTDLVFDESFNQRMLKNWLFKKVKFLKSTLQAQFEEYNNLDNFGSLYIPRQANLDLFQEAIETLPTNDPLFTQPYSEKINAALFQAEYLSHKYHCVVTNPPYMGSGGMNEKLKHLLNQKFAIGKADSYSSFILRCENYASKNAYVGMVTMESWMFLSSFMELRKYLIENVSIHSFSHFGWHIMRIAFGTCSFVFQKSIPNGIDKGVYSYLEIEDMNREKEVPTVFPKLSNSRYNHLKQNDFTRITGNPFGYWLKGNFFKVFESENIGAISKSDGQTKTGNNDKYLRLFWEVSYKKFGKNNKWIKHPKGGSFRRWYGNLDAVVDWSEEARIHYRKDRVARILPDYLWWKKGISWTLITGGKQSFRDYDDESIFNLAAPTLFFDDEDIRIFCLGLLNTKISEHILKILNPTLNCNIGEVQSIPLIKDRLSIERINAIVMDLLILSKADWNSRETSWDFQQNQLIQVGGNNLIITVRQYKEICRKKFGELHKKEEELNDKFIELYELKDELTSNVPLEDITILQEESKIVNGELFIDPIPVLLQLLSYSVGCLFGRYSLDKPGLILANQAEILQSFLNQVPNPTFMPDEDNIIPVLDGEWFTDDIVGRFKVFLKAAFGEEHFEENLKYIEDIIGKDIRKYFVKDFYDDHIKRYKKRPIYWMFSSPKGYFKALIYMHRYQPDLCSKMMNDYLQAFISKLEAAKQTQTMLSLREDISAREKTLAIKEIDKFVAMIKDCKEYEKTLFAIATQKISIDLDDGVKVNYQKFRDVLVPIKGLEKEEA